MKYTKGHQKRKERGRGKTPEIPKQKETRKTPTKPAQKNPETNTSH
jgi:hypothetical protein